MFYVNADNPQTVHECFGGEEQRRVIKDVNKKQSLPSSGGNRAASDLAYMAYHIITIKV